MSKNFDLLVVTPEGSRIEKSVQGLTLPGSGGGLGILARHAPLVSSIKPGEMVIRDENGEETRYAIGEGFVEVSSSRCNVLTDFADDSKSIDSGRAKSAEERARDRLKARNADLDVARAEAALARAIVRIRVGGKPGM